MEDKSGKLAEAQRQHDEFVRQRRMEMIEIDLEIQRKTERTYFVAALIIWIIETVGKIAFFGYLFYLCLT